MIMRKISILLIVLFLFLFTGEVQAKVLPQALKGGSKAVTAKSSVSTGINVTPRLRSDRRALIVYFSNLQNAKSISYTLTYNTNTQQEGAIGSINLTGASNTSQELLFGTCSKQVCRYHSGVNNARLEVSYTSKTGKKYLRKYKIKV